VRPLAEATQRRIAEGIKRFVVGAERPFVIPLTHQGDHRVHDVAEPLRTITAAHRGELALVSPSLIQRSWGERPGQRPRALDIGKPLGTIVAGGVKHALVAAWMTKHYGGPNGHPVVGHGMQMTLGTVTARDHHAVTTAFLTKFQENSPGQPADAPLHTVMAGATRFAEVRAFLVKYYGATSGQLQLIGDPLHTVTSRARFGLVMIAGEAYEIADIGMRMLAPHELYAAQGFPAEYEIAPQVGGKPLTKTAQIRMAGNSVCPPVARAIVAANVTGAEEARAA
jgi:DNA (cytosine-5)-methyltransferase 1